MGRCHVKYRLLLTRMSVQSKQHGPHAARAVQKMFRFSCRAGELSIRQNWEQNTVVFCPNKKFSKESKHPEIICSKGHSGDNMLVPSTNLNSSRASTHRQTHPHQVNYFCIFGSRFSPCASPPQAELHCPHWLLFSLRWSRAERWTLCYRGASLVFPTEHLVLLAVTIPHPNFANVRMYFGVFVAVRKGQAP